MQKTHGFSANGGDLEPVLVRSHSDSIPPRVEKSQACCSSRV